MARKKRNMKIEWDYSEMFAGLDRYAEHVQESFHETAKLVAMDGLGRMVEAAAVLSGYLRGSGSVHVNGYFVGSGKQFEGTSEGDPVTSSGISKVKNKPNQTLIVWGFNAEYAAKRHELKKPGTKGGGGKFIEGPLKERNQIWMKRFADNLKTSGARA